MSDATVYENQHPRTSGSGCFRSINEPPVLFFRKISKIRGLLLLGISETWKNWQFS
jgi:hypothetical protein